jgi:hypothetical protein
VDPGGPRIPEKDHFRAEHNQKTYELHSAIKEIIFTKVPLPLVSLFGPDPLSERRPEHASIATRKKWLWLETIV